ncbi:MAG: class I SAM-dependent methyltransferase [Planctomycetota bacterium]|nr:MAG: class I SAM-dependent methyltransferase [Planctomycetota bacterium]
MNQDYGSEYAELYARHWWWRAREAILLDRIRRIDLPRGADILDVGCGDAVFFPALSQFGAVRGVEIDRSLIRPDNPYRDAIHHAPLGDAEYAGWQFDLITALDVIEHIENDAAAIENLVAMLRPGGYLVLTVPAFMLLWDAHDERNCHYRRYRRKPLGKLLAPHGKLRELRYLFHGLFFAKAAFRLINGASGGRLRQHAIPPRPVNWALHTLCRAENRLFGPLRIPFGTSVLAILQRTGPSRKSTQNNNLEAHAAADPAEEHVASA